MSRHDRAAKGFVTALIQYGTQIVVQAFLAPVVLAVAGREALGAFAGINQVLGLLSLVDIAHSWSLERFLGQAVGLDDSGKRFRDVFTTARTLLLGSSVIFGGLVLGLSLLVGRLFHLTGPILHQARMALVVIAAWSVIRTPLVAYGNALTATQDLAATNLIAAFVGVMRAVASLAFVLAGGGLFGLMLAGTLVEGVGNLLFKLRFKRQNPALLPRWGIPDKRLLKEMIGFGGHAMFLNVGNMMVFNSGNALAAYINGAGAASGYYTSQLPGMTGYYMASRLGESAAPAINELYGRKELERLKRSLSRLLRFTLVLVVPLAAGISLFNRDVITAWVGPQQYAGLLLTLSLAAFCVIAPVQRIAIIYSFAFGWVKTLTVSALLQGIANFGLALILGRRFGLGGINLALAIVIIPQTVILWRRLGIFFGCTTADLIGSSLWRVLTAVLPAVGIGYWIHLHTHISRKSGRNVLAAIWEGAGFTVTYFLCAFFVTLDKEDKARIAESFNRIRRRTKDQNPQVPPQHTPFDSEVV
jgi:O-antigen/teichoic acid export membrane protein